MVGQGRTEPQIDRHALPVEASSLGRSAQRLGLFRRVPVSGGLLVISTHHPFVDHTMSGAEDYFATYQFDEVWDVEDQEIRMRFWHRPLSTMTQGITGAGFRLCSVDEPQPDAALRDLNPEAWSRLSTGPAFVVLIAQAEAAGAECFSVRLSHPIYWEVLRGRMPGLRVRAIARTLAESVEAAPRSTRSAHRTGVGGVAAAVRAARRDRGPARRIAAGQGAPARSSGPACRAPTAWRAWAASTMRSMRHNLATAPSASSPRPPTGIR